MKEITLHNRDGYNLKLVQLEPNKWRLDFGNFPDWGSIQITGEKEYIKMIDPTPGGPCICVGGIIQNYDTKKDECIVKIEERNTGYIIITEDEENGTID